MTESREPFTDIPDHNKFASSIVAPIGQPAIIISEEGEILAVNDSFLSRFSFSREAIVGEEILSFSNGLWKTEDLENFLFRLWENKKLIRANIGLRTGNNELIPVLLSGNPLFFPSGDHTVSLLSFETTRVYEEIGYRKILNEILSEAPAMICVLRGPDHVFELANEKYLQMIGEREILGKSVKDALPEIENQGFIQMLNQVYNTGKPFVGQEVPVSLHIDSELTNSFIDFLYQPIKDASGRVDGIFVHAIDVTQKVLHRKELEENEKELRNILDTVPVIVWLTNKEGKIIYLNKNWYTYTGQSQEETTRNGWLQAVHPDDREYARDEVLKANKEQKEFTISYRLVTKEGLYRWVIDRGRPKFSASGKFQGYIGSVVDVDEDKKKEQIIKEKEHRTRSIVEEATVATAVYTGKEMRIELANDAMLELWGKERNVVGQTLEAALPELEGQPFHELLQKVYSTGEIYWGKEDRVDLMRNGRLETGYFNFTYKPLRDESGKIYGILNMALDVSEMVESRNLLKEREQHFRTMADLMPEKVINTDPLGEALYFNQNWLDYTGSTSEQLRSDDWKNFVHPREQKEFTEKWETSLKTGDGFEMELRLRNSSGKYLWHLSRAEAVKTESGEILMWIGTNTEIQRLKEEEKRKGDFLKMVSHELKTPVTSIKGYVQLLLNILKQEDDKPASSLPIRPSLERIDNQIVRITRLISEMLDLSRLEENKLELQKEKFNINDLVVQTVQDIRLTNTQHKIEIIHSCRCEIFADKDRIGQVLINFITNAIKYSPESQYIEIDIFRVENGKVAVSVRDRGIGIEEKDQKNIFKKFYRIGVDSEETYAGFGIGLYLANEIIERHDGEIKLKSEKGKGSDFSFILSEVSNKQQNND